MATLSSAHGALLTDGRRSVARLAAGRMPGDALLLGVRELRLSDV